MKKVALIAILSCIFMTIVSIFWYQEMQYLMPTPVPVGYKVVRPEELIQYDTVLLPQQHKKPKLLHFFNPDCPCSRFNLTHFYALNKDYSDKIDFYVVVDSDEQIEPAKELINSQVTIVVDRGKKLAKACGVYSTPQAAIIQVSNELYYRGNYNRSRYCTNKDSNFVQMALDSLVAKKEPPIFNELATNSYGCSIPTAKTSTNQ
ncbi:MAG TPA: DUF6436 domain-containing protein [Chryseolinea sp.]|nr:DUF6436 domain-containing protein [Chryseolinea sp.]